LTAFATIGILSLTAGLFFMLPRTADAAFRHLISHRIFLPGFSNQIMLGQIGEIKNSSRAVMHIRVDTHDAPRNLKWRGAALSEFDGRRWFNASAPMRPVAVEEGRAVLADEAERGRPGRRILYRVDLNNLDTDALFFTGRPENIMSLGPPLALFRDGNSGYRLAHLPPEGFQYEAYSLLETGLSEAEAGFPDPSDMPPPPVRHKYLQLPAGLDGRIPELAKRMTVGKLRVRAARGPSNIACAPSTATPSIYCRARCPIP